MDVLWLCSARTSEANLRALDLPEEAEQADAINAAMVGKAQAPKRGRGRPTKERRRTDGD